MSRVAKAPVAIPSGVEVTIDGRSMSAKGPKGSLAHTVHAAVDVARENDALTFEAREGVANATALAGTTRALVNNMVTGVSRGFEKKLQLVGVGYRAQMQGRVLNLSLGYSHPVDFAVPEDISVETPSNTEIVVRGIDKQRVGQIAAIIRSFRPPEPYKGKGVRYADETISMKVAKKK